MTSSIATGRQSPPSRRPDMLERARRHIRPEDLSIVVVGDATQGRRRAARVEPRADDRRSGRRRGVIVVVGRPGLDAKDELDRPRGADRAWPPGPQGADADVVGSVGDDAAGDRDARRWAKPALATRRCCAIRRRRRPAGAIGGSIAAPGWPGRRAGPALCRPNAACWSSPSRSRPRRVAAARDAAPFRAPHSIVAGDARPPEAKRRQTCRRRDRARDARRRRWRVRRSRGPLRRAARRAAGTRRTRGSGARRPVAGRRRTTTATVMTEPLVVYSDA